MRALRALAALLGLGFAVVFQVNNSDLAGIVRDATGAPIPEAKITLTNIDTGTGLYRFTLLDRGTYRRIPGRPSFKRFQRDGVGLQTGETTTIDVTLTVGEVAEIITVAGEPALLRTETGALRATISTQVLNELALIGRNPCVFLALSAGVSQFVARAPFTLRKSSTRKVDLHAPGMNKWDIGVHKSVEMREQMNFRPQAEFYNALNRTHFAAPNTTRTSTSFGRITDTFPGPRELPLSARFTI